MNDNGIGTTAYLAVLIITYPKYKIRNSLWKINRFSSNCNFKFGTYWRQVKTPAFQMHCQIDF
jgi:hypothetical protein